MRYRARVIHVQRWIRHEQGKFKLFKGLVGAQFTFRETQMMKVAGLSSFKLIPPDDRSLRLIPRHRIPPHHTSSHLITAHHSSSQLITAHHSSSHLITAHHTSSQLITAHHSSSQLITAHHSSSQLIAAYLSGFHLMALLMALFIPDGGSHAVHSHAVAQFLGGQQPGCTAGRAGPTVVVSCVFREELRVIWDGSGWGQWCPLPLGSPPKSPVLNIPVQSHCALDIE